MSSSGWLIEKNTSSVSAPWYLGTANSKGTVLWTRDNMVAKMFNTKADALNYLVDMNMELIGHRVCEHQWG